MERTARSPVFDVVDKPLEYALFCIEDAVWSVPISTENNREKRQHPDLALPNFGIVIPDQIYRGGWPRNVQALSDLRIEKVVSLFSPSYAAEAARVPQLSAQLQTCGIEHQPTPIEQPDDYFQLAQALVNNQQRIYLHCSAGANRTSIVSLLVKLQATPPDQINTQETMKALLKESLYHGFDNQIEKTRQEMEAVILLAQRRGLWQKTN